MQTLLLALLLACGAPRNDGTEICGDGFDNDGDGKSDCVDEDCIGVEFDQDGDGVPDPCPEFCGDGLDNDGDGLVDCEDPACDGTGCPESCTDGRDNDKDGKWDCQDADCEADCDLDGDGYYNADYGGDDCNDAEASAYPGAPEICDEIDNDCDGDIDLEDDNLDRETLTPWYTDADGDGFGLTGDMVEDCVAPPGRIATDGDCHDGEAGIHPNAQEICDGIDNDCDGLVDQADGSVDMSTAGIYYPDTDGDGFGDPLGTGTLSCPPLTGQVTNNEDCDDSDPTLGAEGNWLTDADGDGFGSGTAIGPFGCVPPGAGYVSESLGRDCDDGDDTVNPGASDPCGDGVDSDCDTQDCAVWFDGFEYGLTNNWTTGGDANWFAHSGGSPHSGASLAECGNVDHSQFTWLETTASFPGGGTVRFWHMGSTESGYDYLRFFVDGNEVLARSGTWSWTEHVEPVVPGAHTLEWEYYKDGSVNGGSDTVWIDDVTLDGATP